MLEHLYIKNFTIIDELDIPFRTGFSVITGETGAGKSIILGAISLLLGQRADTKLIKAGERKCTIEAHFHLANHELDWFFDENDIDNDPTCILRRELMDTGKSRAFINDTPVSLTQLKELGEHLVDIHSQHQNLLLQQDDFQLGVVDIVARNEQLRQDYHNCYKQYREAQKQLDTLRSTIANNKQDEDFLRFQHQELETAQLAAGMQDELEKERDILEHAEDIKGSLSQIGQLLDGEDNSILSQLRTVSGIAENTVGIFPTIAAVAERMESARIELQDISDEISRQAEDIEIDPKRLDIVNSQLDTIYHLEQKHHVETVEELITIRDELGRRLDGIDNSDSAVGELQKKVSTLHAGCIAKAEQLSKTRQQAAKTIEQELQERLIPLGIPNVRFQVDISRKLNEDGVPSLTSSGIDNVQFLFSANRNAPLRPVAEVASGGEIARVMLSVKAMISGMVKLPTIIFDEIDTGISGKIAQQMALIMKRMGEQERQVISITHLPQIAAAGSTHYKVFKEDSGEATISRMKMLDEEERIAEIAQMMSGADISEAAINNARELLRSL